MTPSNRTFAAAETRRRYARPRSFDVRHVKLELEIDERRRHISGSATVTLAPINDGLRDFEFDLDDSMHVSSVRMPRGAKLRWRHEGDRLRLALPRAAAAGHELQVRVDYQGSPRRGLWFTSPDASHPNKPVTVWSQGQDEDSRFWFPCWDSPNDKFTSETIVTVRAPYRVISNGKLVEVTEDKRRKMRTYHWREQLPHPAYLTSVVVGEFEEVRETVADVELLYYVHPSHRDAIKRTFGNTPAMLEFFAEIIDYPYPYEKYSQVVVPDFIFGGMENISATTLTEAVLLDKIAAAETHSDWLIAHELAHQWWGNLLTCKEWSHAWLNEGFATYFEALFTEHHRGRDEFLWQMDGQARSYFQEDEEKYRRPVVERRWTKPIEIFDSHLYEKGSLVLHMLRFELGDELFWKALQHYARKHQFQNVETTDLKVAIEEATGQSLDAFFDQWVYAPGFPQLGVSWSWDDDLDQVALRVRQTQNRDSGTPLFDLPLEIELGHDGRATRTRIRVRDAEHTFHLPSRGRPTYVRVDPDHWILKKLHYEPSRSELLAQLELAPDYLGKRDAAEGLERFRNDPEVSDALRRALAGCRFFALRRAFAKALGRVGGDAARQTLLGGLKDRDPRSRRGVVTALGEFRDEPQVVERLQRLLQQDKSYLVRAEVLAVLARLQAPRAFEACKRALRVDSHRDMVRAAALRALGALEDERGIELATAFAAPGHSRWSRDAAMQALAELGRVYPARARAAQLELERYLRDPTFFAQLSATQALGKLGRSQAVPALRRLEREPLDGRIQKAAREAIERLTSDAKVPESWRSLRNEVRELQRDNRDLRERLEKLEARVASNGRQPPRRRQVRR